MRPNQRFVALGLAALATACAHPAAPVTPASPAEAAPAGSDLDLDREAEESRGRGERAAPALFRVRAGGGPPSYILGTIHVGVAASELPAPVWQALGRAQVFAMETDVRQVAALARDSEPPGPPIKELLSTQQWARLESMVGADRAAAMAGLGADAAYGEVMQALYPSAPRSMDVDLLRAAVDRGVRVRFLEDLSLQLDLARRYADPSELTALLDVDGAARRDLDRLVALYRRGDLRALASIALDPDDMARDPQRFRDLFFERNRAWAARLSPWLRDHRCFIAVGVGHLLGNRGLLSLLRQRGFEVSRVNGGPVPDSI